VLRLPCGSGGRAGNHCAAAFPAAAANNNGRDLLEMGIYLDRLLQVQMASVSEKCGWTNGVCSRGRDGIAV
jgi:hypothetical protein